MDKITHTSGTFPLAVACQKRELAGMAWRKRGKWDSEDNRIPVSGQFSVYDTDRLLKLWIT